MSPAKGKAPTLAGDEALSETQSTTQGNHMSIIALQPSQPNGNPATMTSREIAELTGKEHANVMRDIRTMLETLKKDVLSFEGIYLDAYKREQPCFHLDHELTLTLVSGYDIPLRHRVVVRLAELESQTGKPAALNLRDPKQLAQVTTQLLALTNEQATQIATLEHQIEDDAPKIKVFDRIALADGDMPISVAAKSLGIDPLKRLFQWMHEHNWIYKRVGSTRWLAHQDKIKAGLLDHRNYPVRLDDGTERLYQSVIVLAKGLQLLAQQVPKDLTMPMRRNGQNPQQPGATA